MLPPIATDPSFSHLPPLQDAFRACDHSMLASVVMSDHVRRNFPAETDAGYRAMRRSVGTLFETMCRMDVSPSSGEDLFLLPEISYSVDARMQAIRRWVSASLFDLGDAAEAIEARSALGKCVRPCDQAEGVCGEGKPPTPLQDEAFDPFSYSAVSWERVLSWRVLLPFSLCARERYMVLASAFWEMTFYGLEYDWACDRLAVRGEKAAPELRCLEGGEGTAASNRSVFDDGRGEGRVHPSDERELSGFFRQLHSKADEDKMNRVYLERLAREVAILNRKARIGYLDLQIQLARRMGLPEASPSET